VLRVASLSSVVPKIILVPRRLTCLVVFHISFPIDVFAVRYLASRVHLLYSRNAALERSWKATCVRRVKHRLLYSPIAAEIANSLVNQWKRGLRGSNLIVKIARTPSPTGIVVTGLNLGD
jgi:hypothetical protein